MRGIRIRTAFSCAAAILAPGLRGEIPFPAFASERDFLTWTREGTFDPQLEIHLAAYALPPAWSMELAATRSHANVISGAFGSTTSWHLAGQATFLLNHRPMDGLQVRFERSYLDRMHVSQDDERLSVLWFPRPSWALIALGWPAPDKAKTRVGLGFRLGASEQRDGLEIAVMEDRPFWGQKARVDSRFTKRPRRLLAEGFLQRQEWRIRASLDLGSTFRLEEPGPGGGRNLAGFRRIGEVAAAYDGGTWTLDTQWNAAALHRRQQEAGGGAMELARTYQRLLATFDIRQQGWLGTAWLGRARQRDETGSPSLLDGRYRMDALLFGAEAGRATASGWEVRLGYIGSVQRMVRHGTETTPLLDEPLARSLDDYTDKAHLRLRYGATPRLRVECMLSQTIAGARFGGAALKLHLVF